MFNQIVSSAESSFGITTDTQFKKNPAVCYVLTLGTDQSRKKLVRILNSVARFFGHQDLLTCPWEKMKQEDILTIKTFMQVSKKLSPATVNLTLCAIRGVVKQAWALEQISDHDERVCLSVKGAKGGRIDRGRSLKPDETRIILLSCESDNTPKGLRDACIISLGFGCGLRRNEIAELKISGIRAYDKSIIVLGKGDKERLIYPSEGIWNRLMKWLELRGNNGCPFIFTLVRKGSHIDTSKAMTVQAIYKMIGERAKQSGIMDFSPHDLRRTFATRMLDLGADLNTVKDALGHASVTTTQRYDKRGLDRIRSFSCQIS